jgi:hypothetical protein
MKKIGSLLVNTEDLFQRLEREQATKLALRESATDEQKVS